MDPGPTSPEFDKDYSVDKHGSYMDSRISRSTDGRQSSRFRESVHLIPTPGSSGEPVKRFEPFIMRLGVVAGLPLLMLLAGLGLEIAIFLSRSFGGFGVPESNVFDVFGNVSAQFLASFFPTLVILPLAFAWRELDWMLRWYQPYIALNRGNATAEDSLLLDYIALGPFLAIPRALQYKHRIIFWSCVTAVLTYMFQPLGKSIFTNDLDLALIKPLQLDPSFRYVSCLKKTIGLSNDPTDLSGFLAAAGYVDASVIHGLGDPPFVDGGWATAKFTFPPKPYLNGTLTVLTTGLRSVANCSNPIEGPTISSTGGTNLAISATSVEGCQGTATFNPSSSTQQYGVENIPCSAIGAASLDPQFQPVMFWFFHTKADNSQQAKAVFCTPRISSSQVQAVANLNDGSLTSVTGAGELPPTGNNVFGGSQAGKAFNGVIFPLDNITDTFIQARSTAIRSIVPASIFRAAQQPPNDLQATFDLANGFLDFTSTLYTRHLSVSATTVYFVDQNVTIPADIESLRPRLVIDPLPAHALAIILILTGIIGTSLQVVSRKQRKKLMLAAPPGSIAAVVSLTSRSGFGDLLLPYDDEKTLERKLRGLRFRLDQRTGAIVADDDGTERDGMGPDDAMMALLGNPKDGGKSYENATITAASQNSSFLAYQAATGQLPWAQSWEQAPSRTSPNSPSTTAFVP
ncbi:hypothetical protein CVT24_005667 [Panaeolus cyanescens]|uniref:Uncharacterized protein n=1 Tax=Panaeolus cyanescens TaxID=181874 RepID=A0A409WY92_9AGAR|nr:hypothetical protein CVT24_005667 [Panaeolus cyanescens]